MEDENPYQSPAEVGFVEPAFQAEPSPASAWRRLANLLLDYVGYLVLSFAVGIVVGVVMILLHSRTPIGAIPNFLIGLVVYLLYYISQEALWGKTLAKFVTGTRVVSATGTRPTFGQIVGRTFSRMIPFEAFSFLFGGSYPIGWHDKLSNTRVIMDR